MTGYEYRIIKMKCKVLILNNSFNAGIDLDENKTLDISSCKLFLSSKIFFASFELSFIKKLYIPLKNCQSIKNVFFMARCMLALHFYSFLVHISLCSHLLFIINMFIECKKTREKHINIKAHIQVTKM